MQPSCRTELVPLLSDLVETSMDKKKIIIQICLMLACVFLQVHIILPHFHHDGIVCITKGGNTDCLRCHSASEDHNHAEQHCSDTLDKCDLKQIVMRQYDSENDMNSLHSIDLLSVYCLIYPLSNFHLEFPYSTLFGLREIPYSDNYTSPFTGSIQSLRAPPVFSFLG